MGGSAVRNGYLFYASGIGKGRDFTHCSIRKDRKICQLGLWKGLKGLTDSFLVTDNYSKDRALTVVKRDTKF